MAYVAGPFDSAHLYIQWGGKLPGNEEWSCGLRMRKVGGGGATDAEAAGILTGVAASLAAYHARVNTQINSLAKLSSVKVNAIGTNGKYIAQSTNESVVADIPGGLATPTYPNQVAIAVSLLTGFSRGPAHRGRFYLPMPAMPMSTTGVIQPGQAVDLGTSTDTLLADLNDLNPNFEVAVFSRKSGAAGNRRVTGVEVGTVLDTQRRRRRSLAELYQ